MVSLFCRDDRGKGGKGEVDTREAIERSDQLDKKKTTSTPLTVPSWSGIRSNRR